MKNLAVANEIRRQLGAQTLMMLNAKNLAGSEDALHFKIGRNSKSVTHITITLTPADLYTIQFIKVTRNYERILLEEVENVYFDMMHAIIEKYTGLYTSL